MPKSSSMRRGKLQLSNLNYWRFLIVSQFKLVSFAKGGNGQNIVSWFFLGLLYVVWVIRFSDHLEISGSSYWWHYYMIYFRSMLNHLYWNSPMRLLQYIIYMWTIYGSTASGLHSNITRLGVHKHHPTALYSVLRDDFGWMLTPNTLLVRFQNSLSVVWNAIIR